MLDDKYGRSVSLLCPTCGSDQFKYDDEGSPEVTCASCGLQTTKDDLIRSNSENIDLHVNEMTDEILKDALKGF